MRIRLILSVALIVGACSIRAHAATAVATYDFNNTLAANEAGAPALVATDPLGQNAFVTDTVFGASRTVYQFNGTTTPNQQAGLTVNTTGLVSPENYSVDFVAEFSQRDGGWRRLIDVQNRQSDNGFYVDPSNNLDIFPISGSTAGWTNNVYHHVVLTDNGTTVSAYLDGVSQFSANTTEMNLDADPTDNPSELMGFFLDNVVGGGQGEYSNGNVALIRLWDGVLTPTEAAALANNPFAPEPGSLSLIAIGGAGLILRRKRRSAAPGHSYCS